MVNCNGMYDVMPDDMLCYGILTRNSQIACTSSPINHILVSWPHQEMRYRVPKRDVTYSVICLLARVVQ